MRCRLTSEPDGSICLESGYDQVFVQQLKLALPLGGRQWVPDRKRWLVSALYAPELLAFLASWGVRVQDDRSSGIPVALPPPMPDELRQAFDALFLAYSAPLCVAEASYKALAKYWHPDKGGTIEDFHRVNDAIGVIRRYLDWREEGSDDTTDAQP